MKGQSPVRYTLRYLEQGKLMLKNNVRIITVNYNTGHKPSRGAYDFVFWHLPQLQFKNPDVQFLVFKNMTPSPFLRVYFDNGKSILSQLDLQTKDEIYQHFKSIFCKTDDQMQQEAYVKEQKTNPANFGIGFPVECICTIAGQAPCTAFVAPPKEQRGKYKYMGKDVEEE
ncbi:hypothetical protein C0Q70_15634 [Pomacea canaliculata]|uniref:Small ribosomal subunit protein mS25 n=2 Tax=Pomacea canaliculata TaxID=400727 RepID=A0A2T7NVG4_POMCA|nr:hypothetical protein C0Q70_15634 [Pomacea canaliculata]